MLSKRAPLLALALTIAPPCSVAAAQESALLHVRVARPDGTPVDLNERGVRLRVSVHGEDSVGWPASFHPSREHELELGPSWKCFRAPSGAEVRITVLASPHPLVEQVFRMDAGDEEKRVRIVLAAPVPVVSLGVDVELPDGVPSWASHSAVTLSAPLTGHVLEYSDTEEAKEGLRVPAGTYEVAVHGMFSGGCGNGAPAPQWMVPARAAVDAKADVRVTLRPSMGTILQLRVVHPDPSFTNKGMEARGSNDGGGDNFFGQRFAGSNDDLVRARLISADDEQVHDLTWGWSELNYVTPWSRFPMGADVYQIVPVPRGEYVLVLRGSGIEELRQEITLGPDETTKLGLTPKAVVDDR